MTMPAPSPYVQLRRIVLSPKSTYKPAERLLALTIADYMRGLPAFCWVSLPELAAKTGLSRATIKRSLAVICGGERPLFSRSIPSRSRGQQASEFRLLVGSQRWAAQPVVELEPALAQMPESDPRQMSLFNTDEGDPDPSSVARDATSAARVHSEPGGFTLNPGGVTVTPPSKEEDSGVSNQGQSSRRVGVSGDSSNLVGGDRRPEPPPPPDPDTDTDRRRQIAIEAIAQLRAQLRRTQPPIPEPIRTQAPELVGVPEPIRSDPPAQPEVRTELPPAERKPPAPRPPTDLGAWKQSHASTPDTASEALEWLGAASGGSRRVVALARPP